MQQVQQLQLKSKEYEKSFSNKVAEMQLLEARVFQLVAVGQHC
jgi:hypothetical protein